MKLKTCLAIALAAVTLPASAFAEEGKSYRVSNETGDTVTCGVKKAGSAAFERILLRPGQEWTKPAGSKAHRFMCEASTNSWHTLLSGQDYKLVKNKGGLVVLRTAGAKAQ